MKNLLVIMFLGMSLIIHAEHTGRQGNRPPPQPETGGVFEAGGYVFFGDVQWRGSFEGAQKRCRAQGLELASHQLIDSLKDDPTFKDGALGLDLFSTGLWVQRLGFRQAIKLGARPIAKPVVADSILGFLCSNELAVPVVGVPPVGIPAADPCDERTVLGVTACYQKTGCKWADDSQKCFSPIGFPCLYYTQHGVTPCLNAVTGDGQRCGYSQDSSQCFQKQGLACEYYTKHGVTACLQSGGGCGWSQEAARCYQK